MASTTSIVRSVGRDDNDNNNDNDERPIGIFRIDTEINKSLKSLQELFDSSRNKQQQQRRRRNKKKSLLVFCPPSRSSFNGNHDVDDSDDDDEDDVGDDNRNDGSNKDLFVPHTPQLKKTWGNGGTENEEGVETFLHQEYLSLSQRQGMKAQQMQMQESPNVTAVRPDPVGNSPVQKGVSATPMIKTGMQDLSQREDDNDTSGLPSLVPSTPVLTPVGEDNATGKRKSKSRGSLFGEDDNGGTQPTAPTMTSRGISVDSTTVTTKPRRYRRGSFFFSFLSIVVLTVLALVAAYHTAGKSNLAVQQLITTMQDESTRYITAAKTKVSVFLLEHDIDVGPGMVRFEKAMQQSYETSQQSLRFATQEINKMTIQTVGADNIQHIQEVLLQAKESIVLQSKKLVDTVSAIDLEDHYQSLVSHWKSSGMDAKLEQLKLARDGLMASLTVLQNQFNMKMTEIVGEDTMGRIFQYYTEAEKSATALLSRTVVYYEESITKISNFFESDNVAVSNETATTTTPPVEESIAVVEPTEEEARETVDSVEDHTIEQDEASTEQEHRDEEVGVTNVFNNDEEADVDEVGEEDKMNVDGENESRQEAEELYIDTEPVETDEERPVMVADATPSPQISPEDYEIHSEGGSDHHFPEEIVSDVVLEPVDSTDMNDDIEEQPMIVDEVTNFQPEADDIAIDGTSHDQIPETIERIDTLEPVVTAEDEEAEEGNEVNSSDIESSQDTEVRIVEDEEGSNESEIKETDNHGAEDGLDDNDGHVAVEEEQQMPHVLDEAGLNDIKRRMEEARMQMSEDGSTDGGENKIGRFGFFQRFGNRAGTDETAE